jgi:Na+/melibiose symporter-like transporter
MVWLGYNEQLGAAQSAATALNMRYLVPALALFSSVVAYVCIKFIYNIDQDMIQKIETTLGRDIQENAA